MRQQVKNFTVPNTRKKEEPDEKFLRLKDTVGKDGGGRCLKIKRK